MNSNGTITENANKGGIVSSTLKTLNKVIKAFLGKLSTKELYWSLIKYLGEALSIAFFKSIGEVIFGMGDVLKGESTWYRKNAPTPGTSPASGAFSSNRPSFGGGATAYSQPPRPAYRDQGLSFPGLAS